jgi:hypothetical protein
MAVYKALVSTQKPGAAQDEKKYLLPPKKNAGR